MIKYLFSIAAIVIGLNSAAQNQKDAIYYAKLRQPGVKMVTVADGRYKVFTQKFGNGRIKLLLLHGGPGNGHEYFENFPAQLTKKGVTVYFYEQIGSYYSDSPLDSGIYTPAAFVEQVEAVRKGLGLDHFYLLGHSWGGLLAELYAQKYQEHIRGLILSNVPGAGFSAKARLKIVSDSLTSVLLTATKSLPAFKPWQAATIDSVINGQPLSDTVLDERLQMQFDRLLDSVRYRMSFYHKNDEKPEPLVRNTAHTKVSVAANKYLAKLKNNYTETADYKAALVSIRTNTLLLGGAHDYMFPEGYYDMQRAMIKAKVRVCICPNGAHYTMWDDTDNYFQALLGFLSDIEKGKFRDSK